MMSQAQFRKKIEDDPQWYIEHVLGLTYWEKMGEIFKSVFKNQRSIASGCTGSSKSFTASCLLFAWLQRWGAPSRVITIAPTGRQVQMNIWGYIPAIHRNSKVPLGGEIMSRKVFNRDDWYAEGFSADNPHNVRGIHGRHDLIIFDDGQGINQEMYKGYETAMAGGMAHALILCNKDTLDGEVYEAFHSKRHLYNQISISAYDTPNVKQRKVVIEGMIHHEQVEQWVNTFGVEDDFVRVFVLDQFPKQKASNLVPIEWLEKAKAREISSAGEKIVLGLDVGAGCGGDFSVVFPMRGRVALTPSAWNTFDTMELIGHSSTIYDDLNAKGIFIDIIGVGAGVVHRYNELNRVLNLNRTVVGVNVSQTKDVNDDTRTDQLKFFNLRSKIWWMLRESLDPRNPEAISIPNDPELIAEISAVRYKIHSDKVIRIEPKIETKARLGRSPDKADGLCLANYGRMQMIEEHGKRLVTVCAIGDEEDDD